MMEAATDAPPETSRPRRRPQARALWWPVSLALVPAFAAGLQARLVTNEERESAIRRGRVRVEVDPAAMDLLNGPQGPGSYKAGAEVFCRYEEKDPNRPFGGHTKKFACRADNGERLKVKYHPADNTEVFGEVAGSRLFWALGFYSERMYSVKIRCENCPADPWVSDSGPRATRVFDPATIQKKLQGTDISAVEDEGWTFDELDLVDPAAGGASRAEVDALKLLAVFVNHGDNTPNQQRILCLPEDPDCRAPVLMVTDLGGTFGGRDYYTSFRNWSKRSKIWKDPKRCVADFRGTTSNYRDPQVSEGGRRLLAGLLSRLTEAQIRDLFAGARFDVLGSFEAPAAMPGGKRRRPTVEDWIRVFLDKRAQIVNARCPP